MSGVNEAGREGDGEGDGRVAGSEREEPGRERVVGVSFYVGTTEGAVEVALGGGLVLAPSGPGLAVDWVESAAYREALKGAEVNLTDSGFMLLLWRVRTGRKLPRLSGLGYLRAMLARPEVKAAGGTFWVMPSEEEQAKNLAWLRAAGVEVGEEDCYVAPIYGEGRIEDVRLVERLRVRRPRVVVLAIGGGVQERLGWALRKARGEEPGRPGVVCIGAAIGFLSGTQVAIPEWVDRWMLGWLWRLGSSPRRFAGRYGRALRLAWWVAKYGAEAPPLREKGKG